MTDVGRTGEAVAAKYYQQRGWLLLNHNYRTRLGELDLILYKENTLVFAEVKTRTGAMLDRPAAAVDARKQNRLILAAQQYLQHSPYRDAVIRFDVVEVTPPPAVGRCIASRAHLSVEKTLGENFVNAWNAGASIARPLTLPHDPFTVWLRQTGRGEQCSPLQNVPAQYIRYSAKKGLYI